MEEEVGGEGWLVEGIDGGGFEVGVCELLDWRLFRV